MAPCAAIGVATPVQPSHLYVHAPFCARRCSYCDFAVHVDRKPAAGVWLDAIDAELGLVPDGAAADRAPVRTLYVGGGTPSLLGTNVMAPLLERLGARVPLALEEWTVEANPESFDERLAADWREAGVGRISLGVQTFHAPALRWMGRLHGPDGPGRAMAAARSAGFGDVSVDLIFGLPDELERDWPDDLARALELEPDHVSLYGLSAEPGAALGRWVREGRAEMPEDERYAEEYMLAAETLAAAGFRHYEVSNFARGDRVSRHNRAYWLGGAYLGLGPGAHSYLPPERRWNMRDWPAYLEAVRAGRSPVEDAERLDEAQARLERIWLGLRHDGGWTPEPGGGDVAGLLDEWGARGWLAARDPVRLTPAGWLMLDRAALELDERLGAATAAAG